MLPFRGSRSGTFLGSAFSNQSFFDTKPCTSMCFGRSAGIAVAVREGPFTGCAGTNKGVCCNVLDGRPMEVFLAQPRGFCAGVVRAIEIVERALEKYGPPVYVRHEIVHNKYVVESLKAKGAVFVEDVHEVPDNAITVF